MDKAAAVARVAASLREGVDLRLKLESACGPQMVEAAIRIAACLRSGGKVLLFGNGGSAADAQHLAAEFVGRFAMERSPLPAIALTTDSSILTAVGNDYGFEHVFSRQVVALGRPNDVVLGISTSGKSINVIEGLRVAGERGMQTIALSGNDGGPLARVAGLAIVVPSKSTARIQECHISIGHIVCEAVELELFAGDAASPGQIC